MLMLEKKRKKEIQDLEKSIEEYENKISNLDEELCNPKLYENPERILELTKEREQIKLNLDYLYEKWIELTEN